jgi:hypothetical protein
MYILIPIAGLAVTDPSPGRGELDVPSFQDFDVAHAVLAVQKLFSSVHSAEHAGEYPVQYD